MAIDVKTIWKLIKETFTRWNDDKVPRLGAALSYYTLFSLAPVLIIVISLAGLIFGREAVQGQLITELGGLVGTSSAEAIQEIIKKSSEPAESTIATIIGFATLLVGATGVFVELQDALNTIWGVKPKPNRGIMGLVKDRLLSFAIILGVGFLLLVSLVISAGLTALNTFFEQMPGATILWSSLSFVISFAVITVLFAMIYKVLPDVKIAWSDVWIGAGVTALLFSLGKFLIGLYLGQSSFASTYGAAGSVVVLLVWVYYSSQLLFFGAEFTQVYANYFGSHVVPADNAVPIMQVCTQEEVPSSERNRDLTEKADKVVVDEKGRPQEDAFAAVDEQAEIEKEKEKNDKDAGSADDGAKNGAARNDSPKLSDADGAIADGVAAAESLSVSGATTPSNGASSNGASGNGVSTNGSSTNGASANGASANGAPANGAASDASKGKIAANGVNGNAGHENGAGANGAAGTVDEDLLAFTDHDGASWATHPPVEEVIVIEVRPKGR